MNAKVACIGYPLRFRILLSCLRFASLSLVASSDGTELLVHDKRSLQTKTAINYFPQPELDWMVHLDEKMDFGNAVVQSPFEENVLYVTTYSASLIALSSKDGDILATVNPTPISRSINDDKVQQWSMQCTSGISFATKASGENFLVYSIVDQPPEFAGIDFKPKA